MGSEDLMAAAALRGTRSPPPESRASLYWRDPVVPRQSGDLGRAVAAACYQRRSNYDLEWSILQHKRSPGEGSDAAVASR